jgi:hypothetical protein
LLTGLRSLVIPEQIADWLIATLQKSEAEARDRCSTYRDAPQPLPEPSTWEQREVLKLLIQSATWKDQHLTVEFREPSKHYADSRAQRPPTRGGSCAQESGFWDLAGRQGLEPRFTGPEPVVLPLNDLPVARGRADYSGRLPSRQTADGIGHSRAAPEQILRFAQDDRNSSRSLPEARPVIYRRSASSARRVSSLPTEGREEPDAAGAGAERSAAKATCWLGGRDSNPDSLVQSQLSYH